MPDWKNGPIGDPTYGPQPSITEGIAQAIQDLIDPPRTSTDQLQQERDALEARVQQLQQNLEEKENTLADVEQEDLPGTQVRHVQRR